MSVPVSNRSLHRLPPLDAVRVIGALAVVAHHVGFATGVNVGDGFWGGWLSRLDVGVAIFFVLSGFLLFRPWAHARATAQPLPGAGTYLWRRALRILPAYWVTVAVCLLLVPRNHDASGADWARHLTLTQIYETYGLRHALGHTWSLATEAVFYLLLPLLAALALRGRRRAGRPVLILAVSAAVSATWIVLLSAGVLSLSRHTTWLPSYAIWFGAGMALASVHVSLSNGYLPRWRFLDDLGRAPLACWATAVALLGIATTPIAGPRDLTEPTATQFGFKVLIYTAIAVLVTLPLAFGPPTRTKEAFGSGFARWFGLVSYGLFLWHPFVLEMIYVIPGRPEFTGDFGWTYAATVAGGLLLAALSYYLIEKPFLRLGHRRRRRPPGKSTESQSATPAATAAS
ncbi:acyltransferase [Actinoplanes sp. LDG1-06]|uniref:Acyltransferase n=1 Tax=Paractinoplanes ovalisporus TaxID=2810368 RepID=A0ABS2A4K6_9ACTN|nr:acyltransferase [Actinoplanes ovalisporus]MBM2614771.1 acyltransferase [Actinoplanes ovalisporus]